MSQYVVSSVQVLSAHGSFTMECDGGQRVEFELSSIGRDHVNVVSPDDAARGLEGVRARLLWVMSGPDDDAQEAPAVLRAGMAHTLFVAGDPEVRTIELPVATRLYATDLTFNSEVPAERSPTESNLHGPGAEPVRRLEPPREIRRHTVTDGNAGRDDD
ncbi:hypothetical protein [Demequina sp. NBRC 110055]|uniref:hypothetical protein n=1 Tax=Demequina sp. NBRC 110055 TaxID=1570344 RepID=UPI0009FFFD36|nr:hypothetical protein [Demequina sp. NBRC 110055]